MNIHRSPLNNPESDLTTQKSTPIPGHSEKLELYKSKVVKWSYYNLALVVFRILVWAKDLTSALHTEFQLVQGGSNACLLHHQAGEAILVTRVSNG